MRYNNNNNNNNKVGYVTRIAHPEELEEGEIGEGEESGPGPP